MKSGHANQLSTAPLAALASLLPADGQGATWIHLLPAGLFRSPRDGRQWNAGDRTAMEAIVAASLRIAGATELVVDYDHQSVFGAKDGVGGRAPAAGWIKEMQARDDGIWGRVEWTAAATAAIRAQEYRYLSPVFMHSKAGKVLAIRMAALTNTPALDLAAVAASAQTATKDPDMDNIAAALGLASGSGEEAILSALNALLASSTAIARAAGLGDGAKPDEVLTAVNTAVAAASKVDPTKFVPIAQVQALQEDVKKLRADMVTDKAEEAVATAIKDGKLVPALRQWGLDLYRASTEQFATFVGSAPVLTAPQLKAPAKTPGEPGGLDDAQMAACKALGLDPKAYAETLKAERA